MSHRLPTVSALRLVKVLIQKWALRLQNSCQAQRMCSMPGAGAINSALTVLRRVVAARCERARRAAHSVPPGGAPMACPKPCVMRGVL